MSFRSLGAGAGRHHHLPLPFSPFLPPFSPFLPPLLPSPFWPQVSTSWSAKSSETPSSAASCAAPWGTRAAARLAVRPRPPPCGGWHSGGGGNQPSQARYLGALVTTERRGIGEARCLVQQQPGAPLHEPRAIVDGVGQVPQPRARGLVERREADGLQESLHHILNFLHLYRFLAEQTSAAMVVYEFDRGGSRPEKPQPPPPPPPPPSRDLGEVRFPRIRPEAAG